MIRAFSVASDNHSEPLNKYHVPAGIMSRIDRQFIQFIASNDQSEMKMEFYFHWFLVTQGIIGVIWCIMYAWVWGIWTNWPLENSNTTRVMQLFGTKRYIRLNDEGYDDVTGAYMSGVRVKTDTHHCKSHDDFQVIWIWWSFLGTQTSSLYVWIDLVC
jgi:hypothetical protein